MLRVKRGSVVRETEKKNYCHEHCYTERHIKLWVKKGRDNKLDKTNIMMRRWNHNVILFRGISRFLSAVCRRWFPGQSGDRTCLVLYKRLVICFARPFQLVPSACTSDIPLALS